MNSIIPASRPMQPRQVTAGLLLESGVRDALALVGERGYYRDGMGVPNQNDIDIYDDAIFVTSPDCHVAFNANVDPSICREGVAMLAPGVWRFGLNIHGKSRPPEQQYTCLEQVGPVTVHRDDDLPEFETGEFAIQIHRGGNLTTASLGCQTIPPEQWDAFITIVKNLMGRYQQETVPYLLIDRQG